MSYNFALIVDAYVCRYKPQHCVTYGKLIAKVVRRDSMADNSVINEAEVLKVLTQEYLSARQEVLLHLQLYKTVPTRNAAILAAVVGLLAPLLAGERISMPVTGIVVQATPWIDIAILFTISTIAFLLVFSVLALLFSIQVLGERCLRIEVEINNTLRGRYLFWEHFTQHIWSTDSVLVYKMPDAAAAVFFHILVVLFAVALPFFVLLKIRCGTPDKYLIVATFIYTFYLFGVAAISFFINWHIYSTLRRYIRHLYQQVLAGNDPPRGRAGLGMLLIIAAVAGTVGCVLLVIALRLPNACAHIGTISASPLTGN